MEAKKENFQSAATRRRTGGDPWGGPAGPPWVWIFVGTLVLCWVAFFSGVRMGKTWMEWKAPPKIPEKHADLFPTPPFYSQPLKEKEEALPREAKVGAPESRERPIEKKEPPAPSPPRKVPERTTRSLEKTPPPAPEKKGPVGVSKPRYTLQVGAFHNEQEARELVNQLKKKGYPAYQTSGNAAARGTLHRVRIGQFPTLEEAKQFALHFERKEKIKTLITGATGP
jgi:cell division septation protein DedD